LKLVSDILTGVTTVVSHAIRVSVKMVVDEGPGYGNEPVTVIEYDSETVSVVVVTVNVRVDESIDKNDGIDVTPSASMAV
jgi:hypothetical protein